MRMGLPAIGSKLVNKYDLEFVVESHVHLATADTCQRWRDGGGCIDEDLYPSLIPLNMSDRFTEFIGTVDRCTPKTFLILDTVPHIRRGTNVPGGNYLDTAVHPDMNLVFLDAARVHESVFAHEIGHAWVQFVDQIEDMRTLKDMTVPQRFHQLANVQSFVSDLRVNEVLDQRGFDLSPIIEDRVAAIESLGRAIQAGYLPEHKREEVFIALMLASEILERGASDAKLIAKLDDSLAQVGKLNPKIGKMAEGFAGAVSRNGYGDKDSLKAANDECLVLAFEHTGDPLDLDNDLAEPPVEEVLLDKSPDWFSGAPMDFKCDVGRIMARNNVPYRSSWKLLQSENGRPCILFESLEGRMFGPFPISHPYLEEARRRIEFTNHHNRRNIEQTMNKANATSNSVPASPPVQKPFEPPMPPGHGNRLYMPGLARFLTQAMLQHQVDGEHPYQYALDNPSTYVDPSGSRPTMITPPVRKGGISPMGQNYGSCAVYICSEHTIDWAPWIPSHKYICVTGPFGGCSGGLYPKYGNPFDEGQILPPGTARTCPQGVPANNVTCDLLTTDCEAAVNTCACLKASMGHPGHYVFPIRTCYSYPAEIYNCACMAIKDPQKRIQCLTKPMELIYIVA